MKSLKLKLFLLALGCLFAFSCANKTLIRDSEYEPVYRVLTKQDAADEALLVFPQKEEDGFITTFEKAWIKFWTTKEKLTADEIKAVQKLSDEIERRKFVSVSHEASVFLVGETEDGYIPSEHEIISLHLFLSMLYLDIGDRDSAHVELKRAIEYLANNPEGKETTFDDPAIRVWLASLWEAIGDTNAATVDLRKAMELSGNQGLQKLIDSAKRKIKLVMMGMGPRTNWSASGRTFFFEYNSKPEEKVTVTDFMFPTNRWYEWHQNRNTKIRERLLSSHYMAASLGQETSRLSKKTVNAAFAGVMYTVGIAAVAGGIYAAIQVGDPEAAKNIIYLTAAAGAWIFTEATEFYQKVDSKIEESRKNEAEALKMYRMIRFLPSQIQYVDESLAKSKQNQTEKGFRKLLGFKNNQVEFIWNPE